MRDDEKGHAFVASNDDDLLLLLVLHDDEGALLLYAVDVAVDEAQKTKKKKFLHCY